MEGIRIWIKCLLVQSTHKSFIRVHMMEEHWSKIPYLLNQMNNEMDGYIKEGRREICLQKTHRLKQVLFKIVQRSLIKYLLRYRIEEEA